MRLLSTKKKYSGVDSTRVGGGVVYQEFIDDVARELLMKIGEGVAAGKNTARLEYTFQIALCAKCGARGCYGPARKAKSDIFDIKAESVSAVEKFLHETLEDACNENSIAGNVLISEQVIVNNNSKNKKTDAEVDYIVVASW